MKKIFIIPGVLGVILSSLLFIGIIDFRNIVNESLINGNEYYAAGQLNEALEAYRIGLAKSPDHTRLNYNAAQASYQLEAYEQAAEYYSKTPGTVDSYLNWGNCSIKLGDNTEDIQQKMQHYTNALETYKQGILEYPENVDLKYNFEYVKEKLKALQDNMTNQPPDENQQNQNQEENQQQDQGDQPNSQEPNDQQQPDSSGNSGDDEEGQQENSENQENREKQENSEDQENPEQNQQDDQNHSDNSGENEQASAGVDEPIQSKSEIDQVLEILEKQEEESLKNNQHMKNKGKEDEYDW